MRVRVVHELPRRIRLALDAPVGTAWARTRIEKAVLSASGVTAAQVRAETGTLLVRHDGAASTREQVLEVIRALPDDPGGALPEMPAPQRDELRSKRGEIIRTAVWLAVGPVVPAIPRAAVTLARSLRFFRAAARELSRARISAEVIDAAAIGTAIKMGDFRTAGVISLLLGVGDYMKLRTEDRARRELRATLVREERQVWVRRGETEVQVGHRELRVGDVVVIRAGHPVPVDGRVVAGEAMIDASSLTGESLPVPRAMGSLVYEGTRVVDGALDVEVQKVGDETRLARIVRLIHDAEATKASVESRADRLADGLVPYVFGAAGFTGLTTGDAARAASVLLVDYSCALKLAVPVSMKTCLSEGLRNGILIRGGKHVEALAAVDTVVFDKTGTVTRALPRVVEFLPVNGGDPAALVRDAACVEEHFPHPFAAAIQAEAQRRGLFHRSELHGDVTYVVANGVVSEIGGRRFVVGSRAFLARSGVPIPDDLGGGGEGHSRVYVAVDDRVAGMFSIEDPVREEVPDVLASLRALGVRRLVLLTGDSEANARRVAGLGFDEYHAEISPEDKAAVVRRLAAEGRHVAMVGDGMNDAPALAAASVGISFQHGADLAKGSADVLILRPDLVALPQALELARRAMGRVRSNFRIIAGVNTALIALGAVGLVRPALSGALHNATTIWTSARSLRPYLR
jgi:heavy metal translocating P-type ATPase